MFVLTVTAVAKFCFLLFLVTRALEQIYLVFKRLNMKMRVALFLRFLWRLIKTFLDAKFF